MTNNFPRFEQTWDRAEQGEISLLHSAQTGNLEAFNALVLKYQDAMYRLALHILGQDAPAEQVTQDAFISAYQHIIHFGNGSLKVWFMRVLVNKCYDKLRHMPCTAEKYDGGSEGTEYLPVCLSKLPVDYRVVLALVDIEGLPYGEVSAILKIPVGIVKSRLTQARLYLQREL